MAIRYDFNPVAFTPDDFRAVLASSTINRPIDDPARLATMLRESNLVLTATDEATGAFVGVARCLTDWAFCCYVSDLAVRADYQRQGIGKELLRRVHEKCGQEVMVLLLAAPAAADYYAPLGFEAAPNAWKLDRVR